MIDLNEVIAAETTGDPIEVKIGRKKFKVKPEMPWETAVLFGQGDLRGAVASITANGDGATFADAVLADHPTTAQIEGRLMAIYAVGESGASSTSSPSGGKRSRPTSNGSTASTSAKR